MKASDFDEKFDSGDDVTEFLDLSKAKRSGLEIKRINVDFPKTTTPIQLHLCLSCKTQELRPQSDQR